MHIKLWLGNKERKYLKSLGIYGRRLLKRNFEKEVGTYARLK